MGDEKSVSEQQCAATSEITQDASTLNFSALNATLPEPQDGGLAAGIDSLYLMSDSDMKQLEQAFVNKLQGQQQDILQNADRMQDIEKELLLMNEEVGGKNDSVSSRVEKFGVLNRSLEKLKADVDNLLMQREHAQNSLSQLAEKMAADQKIIEAEQKRLTSGELYEKSLGIAVDYEKLKAEDGREEIAINVKFTNLGDGDISSAPAYLQLKSIVEKDSNKKNYEVLKHDPAACDISTFVTELNGDGGDWQKFIASVRTAFSKHLTGGKPEAQ